MNHQILDPDIKFVQGFCGLVRLKRELGNAFSFKWVKVGYVIDPEGYGGDRKTKIIVFNN